MDNASFNLKTTILFWFKVILICSDAGPSLTCDQAFFFEGGRGERQKKITPSSREGHRGIIGRGHDLRLDLVAVGLPIQSAILIFKIYTASFLH